MFPSLFFCAKLILFCIDTGRFLKEDLNSPSIFLSVDFLISQRLLCILTTSDNISSLSFSSKKGVIDKHILLISSSLIFLNNLLFTSISS